ncbi:hypothetical protein FOA52_002166 [Chlamydomonas sp. UWO 241]|nr:hypothetical protein FOA52_002166 [Chlamydomonas sp. UWO 241]
MSPSVDRVRSRLILENSELKAQLSIARTDAKRQEQRRLATKRVAAHFCDLLVASLGDIDHLTTTIYTLGHSSAIQHLKGMRAREQRLKLQQERRVAALQQELDNLMAQAAAAAALRDEIQALNQVVQGLKQTLKHLEGEHARNLHALEDVRQDVHQREAGVLQLGVQAGRSGAKARQQAAALRGRVKALKQKVSHLEDAGCCAICLEASPSAGFLHGDTVHRVCRGCTPVACVGDPCPMCRLPVDRVLLGVY